MLRDRSGNLLAPPAWLLRLGQRLHALRRVETDLLFGLLQPAPGEAILDIGCGKGFFCARLQRAGAAVTGIDPSAGELAAARRLHGAAIRFDLGTGERLPYGDGRFDKVISICVLEHTVDPLQVLREARRVLRPGGLLVMSVDALDSPQITPHWRQQHRRRFAARRFFAAGDIARLLRESGLRFVSGRYLFSGRGARLALRAGGAAGYGPLFRLGFIPFHPILKRDARRHAGAGHGFLYLFRAEK